MLHFNDLFAFIYTQNDSFPLIYSYLGTESELSG